MTEPAATVQAERPRFEFRAQVVLAMSIALLVLASMVIVESDLLDDLETGVRAIGVFLILAALVATWLGLGRGSAWATAAAVPILLLTILLSLAEVAVGLPQSRFTIPIAAIAAWWALRAYRPAAGGAESTSIRLAILVVACFIAGWSWGLVANQLVADGGPLRAARDDLIAQIEIDCGEDSGVAPAAIAVEVSWSWARSKVPPPAPDAIAISWYQSDGSGSWHFVPDRLEHGSDPWIFLGSAEHSGAGADNWIARMGNGVGLAIEPAGIFASHAVRLELMPDSRPGAHGDVDIQARYFHGDRWDSGVISEPGGACRW